MKKKIILIVFFNLIFSMYFLCLKLPLGNFLISLVTNLILFILPGIAWAGVFRQKTSVSDLVVWLISVFFISVLACTSSLLGHIILNIKITNFTHFVFLSVITNLGIIFNKQLFPKIKHAWLFGLFFIFIYSFSYLFSSYVADRPFEDSDLDLQGTAYGLIHNLKPRMLTDRKTIYNFSHPLLPAFCAANTILLFGDLDNLKYYFDASLEAEGIENDKPNKGEKITFLSSDKKVEHSRVVEVNKDTVMLDTQIIENVKYGYKKVLPTGARLINYGLIKKMKIWRLIEDCYSRFFKDPNLTSTRTPQYLFTALTGLVLLLFLLKLTDSYPFSIFGSIFYLTIPEIFIAHSSTNYTALSSFVLMAAAYLYYSYASKEDNRVKIILPLLLSGFLCAITNHKTVIFFVAILIKDLIQVIKRNEKNKLRFIYNDYLLLGFFGGVCAYWLYGFIVDAHSFILDHFYYHFLNRVFHRNPFEYGGYFSFSELWPAYSSNLGIPFFIIALLAVAYYLRHLLRKDDKLSVFSLWFIIGAVAFTLVDHKETVHLMYVTPALVVLGIKLAYEVRPILKMISSLVISYALIGNFWVILEVTRGSKDILSILRWL